jgi:hypothetical protein
MRTTRDKVISILAGAFFIGSPAALHVTPPNAPYEVGAERVFRVTLDQDGFLWPESNQLAINASILGNHSLQLARYEADTVASPQHLFINYYTKAHATRVSSIGRSIVSQLKPNTEVMVLIHGFNNDYAAGELAFSRMRQLINSRFPHDRVFLQVHWDGLYQKGTHGRLPQFWLKASTYSQLAGLVGLRGILNELPEGTPVRVVTHSRGASVILSALGNPKWDASVSRKWPKYDDYKEFVDMAENKPLKKFQDFRVAMIAPAIAEFDFECITEKGLAKALILIGFNSEDPVLNKEVLRVDLGLGAKFNATTLGCSELSYSHIKERFPENIDRVIYRGYADHCLEGYLAQDETIALLSQLFSAEGSR